MSFTRYKKYKPSGVEWLGDVPEHWEVSAVKRFSETITDGAHISPETDGGIFPFVSTKDVSGDSIDFENCLKTSPTTFDYMVKSGCRPLKGDVLFSKDGTIGRTVIVKEDRDFVVASSLIIIRPKSTELDSSFLNHLCQSKLIASQVESAVKGAGLPRLSIQNLLKVFGCFPPLAEQTQIAAFLDRETAKIDELVAEQRRLMELLKEKRQAVISHAVTQGLNPKAPMKPSGIEWLGDVPEHWAVTPLKHLIVESAAGPYGASLTKAMYSSSGYRVYGQQQVISDDFGIGDYFITEEKYEEMRRYTVFPGDVLVSVMGTIGKVAVVPSDVEPGIINPRLVKYRCSARISPRYLQIVMMSRRHQEILQFESKGTTMDGLNMQILGNLAIPVPPEAEQQLIVDFVQEHSQRYEALTAEAQRAIDLLQERRTALISAAVTGQIDVRPLSKKQPA
jgi:type I restriction enzyme S subunit